MKKLRRIVLWSIVCLFILSSTAFAEGWDDSFKVRIIQAAIQLSPIELQQKLCSDPQEIASAVRKAKVISKDGRRDPQEHWGSVEATIKDPQIDKNRMTAELAAIVIHFIDRPTPLAPRAFFMQVDESPSIARARFDGYHLVTNYPNFIEAVRIDAKKLQKRIDGFLENGINHENAKVADELNALFNLYVNCTVDTWVTLANHAGIEMKQGQTVGFEITPPVNEFNMGLYVPTTEGNYDGALSDFVSAARSKGLLNDLTLGATAEATDDDELVIEDGISISGSEAQQTANQLNNSDVQIDSGGIDRMAGLNEEALTALRDMGIDVNSARRPFNGTRGGVKPGETIRMGNLDYQLGGISTVEIGSREQKQVYMQLSDSAFGTGNGSGFLNQKVVGAVIQANVGAFKTCFERRLRERPDLSGRVFVEFVISESGEVKQVNVLQNTTGDAVFADCLTRQVTRLRFPPPRGGEVTFVFPFIFEQAFGM